MKKRAKKEVVHRIEYYTRKVSQRSKHCLADKLPRNFTNRNQRLQAYKKMMHEGIAKFQEAK